MNYERNGQCNDLNHDLICGCQKIRSVKRVLGIHNFVSLLHSPVLNSLRGKLRKNLIIIFEDCNRDSAHWVEINSVRGLILLCLCIFTSFFCNFHTMVLKVSIWKKISWKHLSNIVWLLLQNKLEPKQLRQVSIRVHALINKLFFFLSFSWTQEKKRNL